MFGVFKVQYAEGNSKCKKAVGSIHPPGENPHTHTYRQNVQRPQESPGMEPTTDLQVSWVHVTPVSVLLGSVFLWESEAPEE